MAPLRIAEGIVPLSELKSHASRWLAHIAETDEPIVITQNGRAAGVLLSPQAYDRLSEQLRFVSAVREGLVDADDGRVAPHAELLAELRSRYGAPSKP